MSRRLLFSFSLVALLACGEATKAPSSAKPDVLPAGGPVTLSAKISREAPKRLVAIGDLHGDLDATRRVLRLAGAVDADDQWIGGALVVVQTGDEIDRGDDDRKIIDLFDKLKTAAKAAGGEMIPLLGNHELMNSMLDFRYVTHGAYGAFDNVNASSGGIKALTEKLPSDERGRGAAFSPGGVYALDLADRPLFVKVGDSFFVHGGILPKHLTYGLDKMNDETDDFLTGKRDKPSEVVMADDGPVWTRLFSQPGNTDCQTLGKVLDQLGVKRLVMGHTVQEGGITSACEERAFRIDVGMSKAFGPSRPIQALEIADGKTRILKE